MKFPSINSSRALVLSGMINGTVGFKAARAAMAKISRPSR